MFCKIRSEISCWWERRDSTPVMKKIAIAKKNDLKRYVSCNFIKKHYWHDFTTNLVAGTNDMTVLLWCKKLQFAKLNIWGKIMFCRTRSEISCWWERRDCAPATEKMQFAKINHLEKIAFCEQTLLTFLSRRTWMLVCTNNATVLLW